MENDDEPLQESKEEPVQFEKPLSPILSNAKLNRRFLLNRRIKKKSRVKLTERFQEVAEARDIEKSLSESLEDAISDRYTPLRVISHKLDIIKEDSFSLSENESLIEHIEKLEQLDIVRRKFSKILSNKLQNSSMCLDFEFKKPVAPVYKKFRSPAHKGISDTKDVNKEREVKSVLCTNVFETKDNLETNSLEGNSGFQTATGKCFSLSENIIKQHAQIFDDILCPIGKITSNRNNKHTLLLKPDSKNILNKSNSEKVVQNSFTCRSSYLVQNIEKNILREELNNSNKVPNLRREDISLTQEMAESGITNTQINLAIEHALNKCKIETNQSMDNSEDHFQKYCVTRQKEFNYSNEETCIGFGSNMVKLSKEVNEALNKICQDLEDNLKKYVAKKSESILIPQKSTLHGAFLSDKKLDSCSRKSIFSIYEKDLTNCSMIKARSNNFNENKIVQTNTTSSKHKLSDLPLPPLKRQKCFESGDQLSQQQISEGIHNNTVNNCQESVNNLQSKKLIKSIESKIDKLVEFEKCLKIESLEKDQLIERESKKNNFITINTESLGFQTAAGKKLQISQGAFDKAAKRFNDLEFEIKKNGSDKHNIDRCAQKVGNFQPDKGELDGLKIDKTCNIMSFLQPYQLSSVEELPKGLAFQTAGGNKLKISEEALRKAELLYNSIKVDTEEIAFGHNSKIGTRNNSFLYASNCGSNYNRKSTDYLVGINNSRVQDSLHNKVNDNSKNTVPTEWKTKMGNDIFKNEILAKVELGEDNVKVIPSGLCGFSTASGNKIEVSHKALEKYNTIFEDLGVAHLENRTGTEMNIPEYNTTGFSAASGNKIQNSKEELEKNKKLHNDINVEWLKNKEGSNKTECHVNQKFNEEKTNTLACSSFTAIRTKSFEISRKPQERISGATLERQDSSNQTTIYNSCAFSTASGSKIKISNDALKRNKKIFEDIDINALVDKANEVPEHTTSRNKIEVNNVELSCNQECSTSKNSMVYSISKGNMSLNKSKTKKRLGISSCKQIIIPDTKLDRAKLLFEEDFVSRSPARTNCNNVLNNLTPNRFRTTDSSTPYKLYPSKSSDLFQSTITPIKRLNANEESIEETYQRTKKYENVNSLIKLSEPVSRDVNEWLSELIREQKQLELRVKVIAERQKTLAEHIQLLKNVPDEHKRRRLGALLSSKETNKQITLKLFVHGKCPGSDKNVDGDININQISPQNAEMVHFKSSETTALEITKDGAVIIPNSDNSVGLTEIELAFRTMPGVEEKWIPKNWIKNHYKWIIWKLASYERMFPVEFSGCFCIENVIQQLKYRYDREIDQALRSALRRIFEKDDASQKRIILCVSNIVKARENVYELELSDGWYSVRTVIDEPLSFQVFRGKIQIGTKLITSGAELMNCDGCYPLEATPLTCLKINYNSTRRVKWDTKLGYQSCPNPFPIMIHTVHPSGGNIGCIKIYVARVYPIKFMERQGNSTTWRNKKAEERRAQEWENERCRKIDEIQRSIRKEFDNPSQNSCDNGQLDTKELSNINCPETLYNLIRNSRDPEKIQDSLTSSQRRLVMNYENNKSLRKQEDLTSKIRESVDKLKLSRRDVTPVLNLLVRDVNDNSSKSCSFHIWRPTETHFQLLREGEILSVYNVMPRKNGDLSSCMKTKFKPELSQPKCHKYKRQFTPIAVLACIPCLNEFDTVGVVIRVLVDPTFQEIYLTDFAGRILMVNVNEGPRTCLLLDGLKRGQVTSVCNLVFQKANKEVIQATGNHFTIFSSYPKYKHLQNGLEDFKKELPQDLEPLLSDCDIKIELFCATLNKSKTNLDGGNVVDSLNETVEENTLLLTRLTSTDVALSMLDIDKLV